MKKLILPVSVFFSIIFFSLILISSAKAQGDAKKSCYDAYLQCSGNCSTTCRTCSKTSTGYEMCGVDPKCSGACITSCGDAKRTCEREKEATRQPLEVQPSPSSEPIEKPIKQPEPTPVAKPFYKMPVFIGGWYEEIVGAVAAWDFFAHGWRALGDELIFAGKRREVEEEDRQRDQEKRESFWKEQEKLLNDEALWQFGVDPKEILERKPKINEADIDQVKRQTNQSDSPFNADIIKGQVQIKLPGQNEWSDLKQGDKIPPGSTLFTGVDTTTVVNIEGKGVVQVLPFTEIIVSEQGLEQAAKEKKTTTDIRLRKGEIEVNVEEGIYPGTLQVQTPSVVAGVRGTHFWVSFNQDKWLTTVGVYKGVVEVKTKGGKTTTVSPDGDKPGVVVISQKPSVVKLTLIGLVMVAVIGSITMILSKKLGSRGFSKKKK